MRSITCIRQTLVVGLLLGGASPLLAGPPEGCFARSYSEAHLAQHPAQVVREISIAFGDFAGDDAPWMDVQVEVADQGHAQVTGQGGNTYGQIARCFADARAKAGWSCAVECDGGVMRIERLDGDGLLVRLAYFMMNTGDDCGGEVDLAEVPGQEVAYRLDRQPDAHCAGRW